MIGRNEVRERLFKIRLAPTTLARLWGGWPCVLIDWLNSKRDLAPEILVRIEDTLVAAEQLQAANAVPIKWNDLGKIAPLLRPLRKAVEGKRLRADADIELKAMAFEHSLTRTTDAVDDDVDDEFLEQFGACHDC